MIAGLLFIPTTIFDMVWGVRFLQDAHGFDYATAVLRSATVPFGWIIGCPLMGYISDRIGRRKPVIMGGARILMLCLGWILFGPPSFFPSYVLGIVTGIASGAAMLPYTVIKEVNPSQYSGTATGVINFLNFTFSVFWTCFCQNSYPYCRRGFKSGTGSLPVSIFTSDNWSWNSNNICVFAKGDRAGCEKPKRLTSL